MYASIVRGDNISCLAMPLAVDPLQINVATSFSRGERSWSFGSLDKSRKDQIVFASGLSESNERLTIAHQKILPDRRFIARSSIYKFERCNEVLLSDLAFLKSSTEG